MHNLKEKIAVKILSILSLAVILNFQGCQDEEKLMRPSSVEFSANSLTLMEGLKTTINLKLDKAIPADGSITIMIESTAVYDKDFSTTPDFEDGLLTIDVTKGQKTIMFEFSAIDNGVFEGYKIIHFKIVALSDALKLGTLLNCNLVILDDEGPSIANFEAVSAVVYENDAEGIVVNIPLSIPTHGEGSITVQLDSGMTGYGTKFTTNPELKDGKITFNLENDSSGVSFKILPIDDNDSKGDYKLPFSIFSVGGSIELGKKLSYSLRVIDDEKPSIVNFVSPFTTLTENSANGITVKISFSKRARAAGNITIAVNSGLAIYGTHFTTLPETTNNTIILPVTQNQTEATFTILPVDNELFTGEVILQFSISVVTEVMQKGSNLNYTLVISDNESPSIVDFKTTRLVYSYYYYESYPVSETEIFESTASGAVVPILFSKPATAPGSITITWHDGSVRCGVKTEYGTSFTTSPSGSQGSIVIPIVKGDVGASFTIYPVNDNLFNDVSGITFEISEVGGIIKKGTLLNHSLKIIDNEVAATANFIHSGGTINEDDANGILVEIPFTGPLAGMSSITIDLGSDYGTKFTTNPASSGTSLTWNLDQGATGISFMILPIDNSSCDNFRINLAMFTCGFLRRGDWIYQREIVDNDNSIVTFAESSGTISESSTSGKVVALNFSKPISGPAEIYLYPSDGGGGNTIRYTTTPSLKFDNYTYGLFLPLEIPTNASAALFTVTPINNSVKSGDYNLGFTMEAGGCLRPGQNASYSLKIIDDD